MLQTETCAARRVPGRVVVPARRAPGRVAHCAAPRRPHAACDRGARDLPSLAAAAHPVASKAPTVLLEDLQPETAALVAVVAGLIIAVASASSGSSVVFSGVSSISNTAAARDEVASTPCVRIWLSRTRRPRRAVDVPSLSPMVRSVQSTSVWRSSCSSATSKHATTCMRLEAMRVPEGQGARGSADALQGHAVGGESGVSLRDKIQAL